MENKIDSKTLAIEIAKILDKKKAVDVRVLKVESLTVLTEGHRALHHRGLRLQELGAAGLFQRHRARLCAQHPHLL